MVDPRRVSIWSGPLAASAKFISEGAAIRVPAGACNTSASSFAGNDIALLITQDDIDLTPANFSIQSEDDPAKDARVEHVGYGVQNPGDDQIVDGIKQHRTSRVHSVAEKEISIDDDTDLPGGVVCYGDSGGPLFTRKDGDVFLVGVASRGAAGCAGRAEFSRVSFWADAILDTIALSEGLEEPELEGGQPFFDNRDIRSTDDTGQVLSGGGKGDVVWRDPKRAGTGCSVETTGAPRSGALVLGLLLLACIRRSSSC